MNGSPTGYYPEIARSPSRWRRLLKPSLLWQRAPKPSAVVISVPGRVLTGTSTKETRHEQSTFKDPFSSLRIRLVGTVFIATVPPLVLMYTFHLEDWAGFLVGLLALGAAWYGGERFILRQIRVLLKTTKHLAAGDLTSRTGMDDVRGELGQLARTFDSMAESLQQRASERLEVEKLLLRRAQQQTVVAALGQFAMVSSDFNALLNQTTQLIAQTLDLPFIHVLELQGDNESLLLRSGLGWKNGRVGSNTFKVRGRSQAGFVLNSGEPLVIPDLRAEHHFIAPPLLIEHGILSGVCVTISTRHRPYGVLGAYATTARKYSEDEVQFLLAVANVLGMAAERTSTEVELQKLAAFAQLNPNPAMELSPDGNITYFNDTALKLALSVNENHPRAILPPNLGWILKQCMDEGLPKVEHEMKIDGHTLSWSFHPVPASRVVHCYVEDITEKLSLESQLRQAQKMESIGQLAAGVAHDFNNMLTIIQGHAGMLMAKPDIAQQALDSAQAVFFAAERAASLTRQLLMFSRKNVMQIKLLDLREIVTNMSKMLRRLLGETVALEFTPPAEFPLVNGDGGMLEQVVMNLCVNARDAMERGGTLTISLSAINVAADYVQTHPEARPGPHVCLRVSDTGCGMDTYLIGRIFEPFFTTKEVGKGTGLGLATVYGIVKQHEGWVEVSSKLGSGTTFEVFFPASSEIARPKNEDATPAAPIKGGNETLLIVEDEPVLREMAQLILEECGYTVAIASNGREALELWEQHRETIDLLFTDMVMPAGVSGVDLANKLLAERPQLRIVFASGYTVDDISTDFLARNNNARFLQKPYTRVALARIVRETIDGNAKPQKTGRALAV